MVLPGPEQNTNLQLSLPGFSTPYALRVQVAMNGERANKLRISDTKNQRDNHIKKLLQYLEIFSNTIVEYENSSTVKDDKIKRLESEVSRGKVENHFLMVFYELVIYCITFKFCNVNHS